MKSISGLLFHIQLMSFSQSIQRKTEIEITLFQQQNPGFLKEPLRQLNLSQMCLQMPATKMDDLAISINNHFQ